MPVQPLPVAVGYNVQTSERISHGVKCCAPHDCGQKTDKGLPIIDLAHGRVGNLIAAKRKVGRWELCVKRRICCDIGDRFFEINVVFALVAKGFCVELGKYVVERSRNRSWVHKGLKVEHTVRF